jgi:hypothetical protein
MQTTHINTNLVRLDFSDLAMFALDDAIHIAIHFRIYLALFYIVE